MSHTTTEIAMSSRKQQQPQKAVRDEKECTDVLSAVLATMKPPIDVYEGILCLIATFVPFGALNRPII